jgi:hypothetical protein
VVVSRLEAIALSHQLSAVPLTGDYGLLAGNYQLIADSCRLRADSQLATGGDPAAAAKRKAFAASSAGQFRTFYERWFTFDASALKVDFIALFDFGAVAQTESAQAAVGHSGFETGVRYAVFLGMQLPGRPEELNDHSPDAKDLFRACLNLKPLLDRIDARRDQPFAAPFCFDFDRTHTASTVRLKPAVIA